MCESTYPFRIIHVTFLCFMSVGEMEIDDGTVDVVILIANVLNQ